MMRNIQTFRVINATLALPESNHEVNLFMRDFYSGHEQVYESLRSMRVVGYVPVQGFMWARWGWI